MRNIAVALLLTLCCLGAAAQSHVEYDPKLAKIIGKNTAFANGVELTRNNEVSEQKKAQDSIAAMTATLVTVKELSMKTLGNADGFTYESWVYKRIIEHSARIAGASAEICSRLWSLKMGLVIATEITPLVARGTALVRTFQSIVANGRKNGISSDNSTDTDGGNYLNRVDRLNMAYSILSDLSAIRTKLESILLQARYFTFERVLMKLDYQSWCAMWNTIGLTEQIKYSWSHFQFH